MMSGFTLLQLFVAEIPSAPSRRGRSSRATTSHFSNQLESQSAGLLLLQVESDAAVARPARMVGETAVRVFARRRQRAAACASCRSAYGSRSCRPRRRGTLRVCPTTGPAQTQPKLATRKPSSGRLAVSTVASFRALGAGAFGHEQLLRCVLARVAVPPGTGPPGVVGQLEGGAERLESVPRSFVRRARPKVAPFLDVGMRRPLPRTVEYGRDRAARRLTLRP